MGADYQIQEIDKTLIALVIRDVEDGLSSEYAHESMSYLGWIQNYGE